MIEKTSLRIGNLVSHTNTNGTYNLEVIELTRHFVFVKAEHGTWGVPYSDCDGIPLTVEILEKLGFKKTGNFSNPATEHFNNKGFELSFNSTGWFGCFNNDKTRKQIIEVKYLHQLQNLYHALVQNELPKINL